MLDKPYVSEFSHNKPGDTKFTSEGALRDFFLYRDLGMAAATNGQVIAQLVKANSAPEEGTGWHRHEATIPHRHHAEGLGASSCTRTRRRW